MSNKTTAVSFVGLVVFMACAAFLFNPAYASAARSERGERGERSEVKAETASSPSLATGIIDLVFCTQHQIFAGIPFMPALFADRCDGTEPPPPDEPVVDISANPTTITEEGSSTLSWDSEHADSCTASGGWSGGKNLSGTQVVSPDETTTYTITCVGEGGTESDSVTVTVEDEVEAPTVDISADPITIDEGDSAELTWTSENADTCTASNGWSGAKAVDGSEVVSPTATTTYAIECDGDGGVAQDSVTVFVILTPEPEPDEPTLTFSADPTTVFEGSVSDATTTLAWDSTNADVCTASGGWSGSKAVDGSEIVTPTATTTYELDCTGPGGSIHKEVTVDFVPVEEEPEEGKLLITEVYFDFASTTGSQPGNEWVELHNGTDSDIDLANYYIHDATGNDKLPSVVLPAGAFALITGSSTTETIWENLGMPSDTLVILTPNASIGSNGLGNGGDFVWLESNASTTVDAVSWGDSTEAFNPAVSIEGFVSGNSLARSSLLSDTDSDDDWIEQEPNPGE